MKTTVMSAVLLTLTLASAQTMSAEVTYRKDIRSLMQARCLACHGTDAPDFGEFDENKKKYMAISKGPRMNTYAELLFLVAWPDTGAIMRRLDDGKNTKDGKPGNMYANLGGDEEERQKNLKLFKAWIGESAWSLKRRDAITKEELMRIKAEY